MSVLATLIYEEIQAVRARHPERPALIGLSGAQGSGKTTVCKLLEAANRPRFANFSIDDVYFPRAVREERAQLRGQALMQAGDVVTPELSPTERRAIVDATYPLFATRGPPGTHDIALAARTFESLALTQPTPIPHFDKIKDRYFPQAEWNVFQGPAEAILFDAWCLGALPYEDTPPLNAVEREDFSGEWRRGVNYELRKYQPFFARFDAIIYLEAPSWDIVRRWRGQQEVTLRGRPLTDDEETWIDRFIQHYERITRSMMDGRHTANIIVDIDKNRAVTGVKRITR